MDGWRSLKSGKGRVPFESAWPTGEDYYHDAYKYVRTQFVIACAPDIILTFAMYLYSDGFTWY